MSYIEPRGRDDLTGWHRLTCGQSEVVYNRHRDLPGFVIASGFTDFDGIENTNTRYFREWWFDGKPLLRDYRYKDGTPCRHYGAMNAAAAIEVTP